MLEIFSSSVYHRGKSKSKEHTKGKVIRGGNVESVFKLTLISDMVIGGITTIHLFIGLFFRL